MQEILARLRDNPAITIDELMKSMELGRSTILRYLKQLQMDGIIERVGARKYGTWKIVRDL
ncbi:MAG: winged helix-turn-helix transcriptional regulator [Thermoguttaceae bacterium]|nr:winged helix-turn-helix transcriptional regulator [Thermoguttaceae bacterium]